MRDKVPAAGAEAARAVTYSYAAGANPLITSVSDASGTVTTTTDVLGRIVSYSDKWSKVTTSSYDQAGRLIDTFGPAGAIHSDYDAAGRPTLQRLDALTVASATYDAAGELASVAYPSGTGNAGNATSLAAITRDGAGHNTGLTWNLPGGGLLASDALTRSQAGRVVDEAIDGIDAHAGSNFSYDSAGRLVGAWAGTHAYSYAFAADSPGCALAPAAGKNTNATSVTVDATTTTSCYDAADKLVSTSDATVGSPVYDAHGNTTTLGGQSLVYDGADRHMSTTGAGLGVTYVRDATDRIVSRSAGIDLTEYGYSGPGDSADFTMLLGVVTERSVPLLGGVTLTKRLLGDIWSYPNIHGDVMATANASGAKVGSTLTYDPYGQDLGGLPDNSAGNFDYGWLGGHQRGTEHQSALPMIEMGARPYVPKIGRFLGVDPVEGGCANDYTYVHGDPINAFDLDGSASCEGFHARFAHVTIDLLQIGYSDAGGRIQKRYQIYTTVNSHYTGSALRSGLSVYGKNLASAKGRRGRIAHHDTKNHVYPVIKGSDTQFWAASGDTLTITGQINWAADTVDRGSFGPLSWYRHTSHIGASCTA